MRKIRAYVMSIGALLLRMKTYQTQASLGFVKKRKNVSNL